MVSNEYLNIDELYSKITKMTGDTVPSMYLEFAAQENMFSNEALQDIKIRGYGNKEISHKSLLVALDVQPNDILFGPTFVLELCGEEQEVAKINKREDFSIKRHQMQGRR